MAKFTTRVELKNADAQDYQVLHAEMEKNGFKITVISDDGNNEYYLPNAEYNKEGNYTLQEVHDSAKEAANKTKKSNAIFVTKSNSRTWSGLDKVIK